MKAKRFSLIGVVLILALMFSAYVMQNGGAIKGKVVPAENAIRVYAITGTDTVKTQITTGSFEVSKLKAGTYQLWIEATDPYKHKQLTDVQVKEGGVTDVGEIHLETK